MAAKTARAAKTKNVNGRVVSAKSKTNDPACSQAVSEWVRTRKEGTTPASVFAILGQCRAKARAMRQADSHRNAGNEAKAQRLDAIASGKKGPITAKDRLAKAKELVAARKAKPSAVAAPARPSLLEQANAHRASKGTPLDRVTALKAKAGKYANSAYEKATFNGGNPQRMWKHSNDSERLGAHVAAGNRQAEIRVMQQQLGKRAAKQAESSIPPVATARLPKFASAPAARASKPATPAPAPSLKAPGRNTADRIAKAKELKAQRAASKPSVPAGPTKPDRKAQWTKAAKARAKSGIVAKRVLDLHSIDDTKRHFEYRVRKTAPNELYQAQEAGKVSRTQFGGKYVVEERITDHSKQGSTVYKDWSYKQFGDTKKSALKESWDSQVERARTMSSVHANVKADMAEIRKKSSRAHELNSTAKNIETMLTGGVRLNGPHIQSLQSRYQGKYESALKTAKIHKAAMAGTADPAKIKAIQAKITPEYTRKVDQAKRILEKIYSRQRKSGVSR